MKEYKSIEEVLKKGHIYINGLVMVIMISIWIATLIINGLVPEGYNVISICTGLLLGLIVSWLYWSLTIPKWRIWAFENVKKNDWSELKTRAIYEKLIWPDESIFNKTEIRTKSQNQTIKLIDEEIPNIQRDTSLNNIQDDLTLPKKTDYYYAKSELILNPILLLVFTCFGSYLITVDNAIIGFLSIGFGLYGLKLDLLKNLFSPKKQMTISNEGIEINIKDLGFVKWSDTENIKIDIYNWTLTMTVLHNDNVLNVTYPIGSLKIESQEDLLKKINIYQKRNAKSEQIDQSKTNKGLR